METIKELRLKCQSVHVGDFSAALVRSVSIYFTWLFLQTKISGNGVSILNVIIGILAAACFIGGSFWFYALGTALFILNAILDGCDGEVARYREQSSLTGLFADRINSIFGLPLMLFGISVGLYHQYGSVWVLFLGFGAAWGFNALRLVKTNIDSTLIDALTRSKARMEKQVNKNDHRHIAPFSEYLRSKQKWYMTVADFILVRQPGFAVIYLLAIVGEAVVHFGTNAHSIYFAPFLYVLAGYCVSNLLALPIAIYVVIISRRIEHAYNQLTQ